MGELGINPLNLPQLTPKEQDDLIKGHNLLHEEAEEEMEDETNNIRQNP